MSTPLMSEDQIRRSMEAFPHASGINLMMLSLALLQLDELKAMRVALVELAGSMAADRIQVTLV